MMRFLTATLLLGLLLTNAGAVSAQTTIQRLDLNRATLQEIEDELPVAKELALAIYEYRERVRFFRSAYDLSEVAGMTPEILKSLLPLISTMPPERRSEELERYEASFRQVEQFLSREGASEELAEEYLDRLRDPYNVNDLSLYELQSFQNVSPVDAVAILKARERSGTIDSARQLRGSEGLSYWGYRNLRDFVDYTDEEQKAQLHGDLQLLSFDTPYRTDDSEVNQQGQTSLVTYQQPALLSKLRLRHGQWKGGIMTFRAVGEEDLDETVKGFVAFSPGMRGRFRLDKVVAGNYRVVFGQGLVMDNTDYFLPRKTGYGFDQRPLGILGDLSRTHEFALRGLAVEGTAGRLHAIGFFSDADKDGIRNADGSINRYILLTPRLSQEEFDERNASSEFTGVIERDTIEERVFGGNLKMQFWPGTYVGISGYEAQYDAPVHPDVNSLFLDAGRLEGRDSEVYADYDSRQLGEFRRVVGAEFQTVYANVALQGEYAKLDSNPKDGISGLFRDAPEAFLVNGYVQYADLTLMALYRDYDLGFDNPYARAFSQDPRYEQTLVDAPFRLTEPLLANLELNTPQMKPEHGLYLTTRYRVSRSLTITGLEYDTWERQSDGQEQQRYTARLEYAPIFPVRFRVRQRFSSRSEMGVEDVRKFRSWDTRLEMRVRLSGFDELRMLYSTTNVEFAARPRLSEPAESTAPSAYGQAASPAQALQVALVHHFNDDLMFQISSQVYQGFLWNFEDNEFVLLDNTGFRNWFMVRSRLGDRLMVRAKLTTDRYQPKTNLTRVDTNDLGSENSFRVQLDYTF